MTDKDVPTIAGGSDVLGWNEGKTLDIEPVAAESTDSEDGVIVTIDEDLDDIDVPIDPEFIEPWEVEDLDSGLEEEVEEEDEDFNDDAEIRLLQELGIDLDAPDTLTDTDLDFNLDQEFNFDQDQEETVDDGIAA